jgi:hypothetical protein
VYAWYGLYAAAMTLTMAAVTGVAGQLFWNQSPFWADRAQGVLPIALSGINILFLRHLCSLAARYPKVDRLALGTGVLVLLMSAAYPWVEGWASNAMVSFSLLASLVLTFVLAGLAWRRGDPVVAGAAGLRASGPDDRGGGGAPVWVDHRELAHVRRQCGGLGAGRAASAGGAPCAFA